MKLPEGLEDIKELAYITSRKLQNENGEKTGTVMMWRKKGEEEFGYKLTCPYCATAQGIARTLQKETVPRAVQ
jgi:hypothetical protein